MSPNDDGCCMSILTDYLCPPGNGVYTVNTAKEKKSALHRLLYQQEDEVFVRQQFIDSIETLKVLEKDKVALLGVCSDTGGGIVRGANWGPLFIREQLYQSAVKAHLYELGDVRVIPHLLHDKYLNNDTLRACQTALYGTPNERAVSPLSIAEQCLDHLYKNVDDLRVLAFGGDHSVSYPLVKSYLQSRTNKENIALIHFDAHTDLLESRLGIDLCFGSWLTHVLPFMHSPKHVVQLGIRSSGKDKNFWQNKFGITQLWANELQQASLNDTLQDVITQLKSFGVTEVYISFDIDALDYMEASATGTPEPDGLSLALALDAIDIFTNAFRLTGADLVEVAPFVNFGVADEPKRTLDAASAIASRFVSAMV